MAEFLQVSPSTLVNYSFRQFGTIVDLSQFVGASGVTVTSIAAACANLPDHVFPLRYHETSPPWRCIGEMASPQIDLSQTLV
jgi:hypothetical protein